VGGVRAVGRGRVEPDRSLRRADHARLALSGDHTKHPGRTSRLAGRAAAILVAVLLPGAAHADEPGLGQLAQLSLEELLETPVITATRIPTSLRHVPAAVTVITREDIERYGYQTLTQALARVPEVHTHFHGYATEADFRGFWSSQTGNRRVLYLLDGQRLNDPFYSGDFTPGLIGSLANVERIEILRGPGAALYGSVAILGVVNVITRGAPETKGTETALTFTADDLDFDSSFSQRYQLEWRRRFSPRVSLAAHMYWFNEDVVYDSRTQGFDRAWNSSAAEGVGRARLSAAPHFALSVPHGFDEGGHPTGGAFPNGSIALTVGDWTLGGFLHGRESSFVWPLASSTFGHPDDLRSLGTGAGYLEWSPKGRLETWDLKARATYGAALGQTDLDFSNQDFLLRADGTPQISLGRRLALGFVALEAFIGPNGEVYKAGSGVDPALLTSEAIDAHGGGLQNHYSSLDTAWTFEAQANPVKTETLRLSAGGTYTRSEYDNPLWNSFRDGTFLGWHPLGGIAANGYAYGLWGQAIWMPSTRLTLTAGGRFDRQVVKDAHYHLGGDVLMYERIGTAPSFTYVPRVYSNRRATDFTPRLALEWSFRPRSSLRLIYAEAFRAVLPDDIVRLPRESGDAESERSKNYEAIVSLGPTESLNVSVNAFHLTGNVLYGGNFDFETRGYQYGRGSGWDNTGASLVAQYRNGRGGEAWLHATQYILRKPTDSFSFLRDYKAPGAPPLPLRKEALDSATTMVKAGASWWFATDTTVAGEAHFTGPTTILIPVNQNVGDPNPADVGQPNFARHETPNSVIVNLCLRQELRRWGLRGAIVTLGVRDAFDQRQWGALTQDEQQSWDMNTYARPGQLPSLGRRLYVQAGYIF
jgi:outer membrane receptor protein involved in Fe transport